MANTTDWLCQITFEPLFPRFIHCKGPKSLISQHPLTLGVATCRGPLGPQWTFGRGHWKSFYFLIKREKLNRYKLFLSLSALN